MTFSVSTSYATTISNSSTIKLVPEILEMGYSKTISAGYNIGWSKTNNTNKMQELVIDKVYDVLKVVSYSKYENGYYTVSSTKYYDVAKGWAFDLI